MSFFLFLLFILSNFFSHLTFSFIGVVVTRPCLDSFHLERIDKVRAFPERSFHSLVTLSRLAAWGLGLEPTVENLAHEETTCQSKYRPFLLYIYIYRYI